jgi:hypothetical protein
MRIVTHSNRMMCQTIDWRQMGAHEPLMFDHTTRNSV